MVDNSIVCAGIDIGKQKLDVAVRGVKAALQADNTSAGHGKLIMWLRRHKVERVGVEATGGYDVQSTFYRAVPEWLVGFGVMLATASEREVVA